MAKEKEQAGIPVNADDYVIVRHNRKMKSALILNPKSHQAVLVDTLESDEPEHIKYEDVDLVANLGPKPTVGKVHGVHIEPVRRSAEKPYGLLVFYMKLEKSEIKTIKSAFTFMFEWLNERSILNVLPVKRIEIREKRAKWAGMYTIKRLKTGEAADSIQLFCKDGFNDKEFMRYVVAHETGHALWYKLTSEKLKSQWVELYRDRINVSKYTEKQLESLLDDVLQYEGGVSAYAREIADDDTRQLIKEVYSYLKRTYRLDRKNVDLLMDNNTKKLAEMWPTSADLSVNRIVDLGEYAMTKPEEFFAEAFAFHVVGKKLPKDCRKLMEETLKKATH